MNRLSQAALAVAVLVAQGSALAAAPIFNVYESASFVDLGGGEVRLDGFGRGASNERVGARLGIAPQAVPRQTFFDTWNLDTSGIGPGTYSFTDMVVDAFGSVQFLSLTFNSYNAQGVRNTVLFELNALGTQGIASGTFTVLPSCPVASCVWIDVVGTQDVGSSVGGYGGTAIAAVVPEPASMALLTLGLVAVGAAARRRRA